MNKYIYALVMMNCLIFVASAQQIYNSGYRINTVDSILLANIAELKVPEVYKGKDSPSLPSEHDNSQWPYLRPPFYQFGWSCGQASSVGYNFTYEINRIRNLPANIPANQYPPIYTWNFYNSGEYNEGVCFCYTYEAIKSNGQPNCVDYGGMGDDHYSWITGYDIYYNGMFNRLAEINSIYIGDPEGLTTLKYWLHDHMEGSPYGGLATFYTDYLNYEYLPDNTPEAGKCVVINWGAGTGHSMTIVGWNDSIRYDYNNDGLYTNNIDINNDQVIDMKDWEIGGFKFINSFGQDWADGGFCYMMYKTVAEEKQLGGIWNKSAYIIDVKDNYEPLLTCKIKLKHNARNRIKVRGGVSADTTDLWPAHIHEFDIFHFQGGDHYMQGIDTIEAHKTIEFGLDVSPLLSYINPGQPAKFFLQVYEHDPDNEANGNIISFSLMDYLNAGVEIICPDTNMAIANNGYTTISLIHTLDPPQLVSIETEEIPAFTINQPLDLQMEASGGTPPYSWDLLSLYNESWFEADYPVINGEGLIPQGGNSSGRALKEIEFEFPFYGQMYTTVAVHVDGILGFSNEFLPIPYQVDPLYLFRYAPFISPFYNTDLEYNTSQNDKIWYTGNQDSAAFRWDITLKINNNLLAADFCVILFPDGNIQYHYQDLKSLSQSQWLTGISSGDGLNYQLSEYSQYIFKGTQALRYQPQNFPSLYEISKDGLLTVLPTNDQSIYNLTVKVSDNHWISSTRNYQLSSGLIFDYSVNSGENNQVDYGETAYLDISIKNISSSPIGSIVFTVGSDDPYLMLNDYAENIGILYPGQTATFTNAISFTVSSEVPDGYYLPFDVLITSSIKTWDGQFAIRANAPFIQMGDPFVMDNENGWLNPGETGNIIIPMTNMGHSPANEVESTISSGNAFVTFNGPTVSYIEELAKGITSYDTVNIIIDENCPQGELLAFNYEIVANPNLVTVDSFAMTIGRYPVLIIDMDPNTFSGPVINNLLEELDVNHVYANFIPENLAQYQNLFVLLGRMFSYYTLTQAEGELLSNYLLNFGNLYMEGGITWNPGSVTAVHPMFNINAAAISWSLIEPVSGVDYTFTENMEFDFDGPLLIYNNYLIPVYPAFSILQKDENDHIFAIAYDEGTYKTVGSNIDFGGLVDGEHPSTKKNLLAKILIFFGQDIIITNLVDADKNITQNLVCYPNPFSENTTISFYLDQNEIVDLTIYSVQGQKITSIISGEKLSKGLHHKNISGSRLPQGIYHCILTTKSTKKVFKLIIIH